MIHFNLNILCCALAKRNDLANVVGMCEFTQYSRRTTQNGEKDWFDGVGTDPGLCARVFCLFTRPPVFAGVNSLNTLVGNVFRRARRPAAYPLPAGRQTNRLAKARPAPTILSVGWRSRARPRDDPPPLQQAKLPPRPPVPRVACCGTGGRTGGGGANRTLLQPVFTVAWRRV